MKNPRILLTTPDYPPKLGGLSTFTLAIENALKEEGIDYELFHWQSLSELKSFSRKGFDLGLHIHFFGHHYLKNQCKEHVNFLHGSELLFTSPNFLKKVFKKITKPLFLKSLAQARQNIAISEFTQQKIFNLGLEPDFARDLVFHNCINLKKGSHQLGDKVLSHGPLKFICVARDVPHKNLQGCYDLCVSAAESLEREVELYSPREFNDHPLVKCHNISGLNDSLRNELYRECHFNLLLSLDHSKSGFYEGFGLTVLEAAQFGTPSIVSPHGGLPESCHHNVTGWVLPLKKKVWKQFFLKLDQSQYQRVRAQAFEHTYTSHGEEHYQRLLSFLFKPERGSHR